MLGGPQAYHWADCVATGAEREGKFAGRTQIHQNRQIQGQRISHPRATHPQQPCPSLELTVAALTSQAFLEPSPIHARF